MSTEHTPQTVAKQLVPKGWKTCPKCKELVKGPRTGVCPHCKADISKNKTPKVAKVKKTGGKRGRPRKVVAVAVPKAPSDPYTFNEVAGIGSLVGVKGSSVIRRAGGLFGNTPQGYRETLAYIDEIEAPEPTAFENVEVTSSQF